MDEKIRKKGENLEKQYGAFGWGLFTPDILRSMNVKYT